MSRSNPTTRLCRTRRQRRWPVERRVSQLGVARQNGRLARDQEGRTTHAGASLGGALVGLLWHRPDRPADAELPSPTRPLPRHPRRRRHRRLPGVAPGRRSPRAALRQDRLLAARRRPEPTTAGRRAQRVRRPPSPTTRPRSWSRPRRGPRRAQRSVGWPGPSAPGRSVPSGPRRWRRGHRRRRDRHRSLPGEPAVRGGGPARQGAPRLLRRLPAGPAGSADDCDDKVVGATWFVDGFGEDNLRSTAYLSPRDSDGHGTQMASIAAGNAGVPVRWATSRWALRRDGAAGPDRGLQGVLGSTRPRRRRLRDRRPGHRDRPASGDGVDVISLAVGGPAEIDTVERALLGAAEADIVVAPRPATPAPRVRRAHLPVGHHRRRHHWPAPAGPGRRHRRPAARRGDGLVRVGAPISRWCWATAGAGAGREPRDARTVRTRQPRRRARSPAPIVLCRRGSVGRVDKSRPCGSPTAPAWSSSTSPPARSPPTSTACRPCTSPTTRAGCCVAGPATPRARDAATGRRTASSGARWSLVELGDPRVGSSPTWWLRPPACSAPCPRHRRAPLGLRHRDVRRCGVHRGAAATLLARTTGRPPRSARR